MSGPPPWERDWSTAPAPSAPSRPAASAAPKAPWERDWSAADAGSGDWEGSANTAKQDPRWGVTDMKTLEENVMAPGRGVAKGLYNTFAGATRVLAPIPDRIGLGKVFPPLEDDPIGPGEETGSKVGQALAYLAPGGATRRLAGVVAQGAKAAGIAKAQGHDPVLAGALGGAAPIVGPVLGAVAKVVKPKDAITLLKFLARSSGIPVPGSSVRSDIAVRFGEEMSKLSIGKGIGALVEKGKTRIADEILEAVARGEAKKAAAAIAKAAEAHPEVAEALVDRAAMTAAQRHASNVAKAAETYGRPPVAAPAPAPAVAEAAAASGARTWDRAAFPAGKIAPVGQSRIPTILTRPKTGKAPAGAPLTAKQRQIQIDQLRAAEEAGMDIWETFGMGGGA